MPRSAARLSNCYVPLPENITSKTTTSLLSSLSAAASTTTAESQPTTAPSTSASICRSDNRQPFELRQLCLETAVFTDALGSSLVELGHTKVICRVNIATGSGESVNTGTLDCKIQIAPHVGVNPITQRTQIATPAFDGSSTSGGGAGSAAAAAAAAAASMNSGRLHSLIVSRESYLTSQLHSALQASIQLELFPKCSICIRVTILQDDGSVMSACIAAATLALVDAKVPMLDLVTSCTVAVQWLQSTNNNNDNNNDEKKENHSTKMSFDKTNNGNKHEKENDDEGEAIYLADPTEQEILSADACICLALTANHKEVTLWTQSGRLPSSMANEAVELARNGCRTMHKFMRELWISKAST